ncbi:MAG: GTP 3',8-cyclase MoaA [Peptococcaceae bacterium]|nr:GTP 3',8-cyclase MoaA [Peptococcaceae bacterium]
MRDQYQRQIEYLRISITDRCNLRCSYCMPAQGVQWMPSGEILSYEEILRIARLSVSLGFNKFRVTGGEPLLRKGVLGFLKQLASLEGVKDLTLTTNGILLPDMAAQLKDAGVKRLNISLDTLDPAKFAAITRGGELTRVLAGIKQSIEVGFAPVELNVVVMRGFNDNNLTDFVALAQEYPLHIRFIELMPIGTGAEQNSALVTVAEMRQKLAYLKLTPTEAVQGAGPAQCYSAPELQGSIGFISAISQHFCTQCNRVRLTADGKLKPCLHSATEYDLKAALRAGVSDAEVKEAIAEAVLLKPSQHHMLTQGWDGQTRGMSQIGG